MTDDKSRGKTVRVYLSFFICHFSFVIDHFEFWAFRIQMRLRRRLRNVHIINHTSPPWGEEILNKKGRSGNSRAASPRRSQGQRATEKSWPRISRITRKGYLLDSSPGWSVSTARFRCWLHQSDALAPWRAFRFSVLRCSSATIAER